MRLSTLAVLAFASCVLAKNIIYLEDLVSAVKNDKREAKNVVNLDALKEEAEADVFEEAPGKAKKRHQDVFEPTAPLLQSLLPQMPKVSIFSGYLRNDQGIFKQLENADSFVLIVAPTDDAFSRFSAKTGRKPWEYPQEIQNNETDDEVIRSNLQHLVKAHVSAPIERDSAEKQPVFLLDGQEIIIERLSGEDNYQISVNGASIPVLDIHQAENGVVFVVGSVLV